MEGYDEIVTQADMDALLDSIAGFHDSMLKELHATNRGFVQAEGGMMMSHSLDARLLVQSQWAPRGLELLFLGVDRLEFTDPGEYWEAEGQVEAVSQPVERRLISIRFGTGLQICAARLFHRRRTEWLGPQTRFGVEVPAIAEVAATRIEPGWRQCSACADAWQESEEARYSFCPSCGQITDAGELQRP